MTSQVVVAGVNTGIAKDAESGTFTTVRDPVPVHLLRTETAMRTFAIGTLSERSGVKIPTIRYYEVNGLLPSAARTQTNRRTYDDATVMRLRFIRRARELGFEVDLIRTLLDLADRPERPRAETNAIALQCLADIDGRITLLSALREEMQAVADRCERDEAGGARCHVIEVLACDAPPSSETR